MLQEFTDLNFDELALKSDKLVLVDFSAEWCGPCRMVHPIVKELAEQYETQVIAGEVDVDQNPMVAAKYGVRNIPTVLFIKNGQVVDKQVGAVPKSVFTDKLKAHL